MNGVERHTSLLWRRLSMLVAGAASGLLLFAPEATADQVICAAGSGAGQCSSPTGVAVDRAEGLLYVADNGSRRVDVFDADDGSFLRAFGWDVIPAGQPGDTGTGLEVCTSASTCKAGSSGAGPGQFGSLTDIAVDNGKLSPAFSDVYVVDKANNRVQRFHANGEFVLAFGTPSSSVFPQVHLDVGPSGVVHVADVVGSRERDRRVQKFSPAGGLVESCSSLEAGKLEPPDKSDPDKFGVNLLGFAVDSTGNFYLASAGGRPIAKYDSTCGALTSFHPGGGANAFAFDVAGDLFVADSTDSTGRGNGTAIYRYDPSYALRHVLYGNGTLKTWAASLVPYESANGDIFATEAVSLKSLMRVVQIDTEPPGPVVIPDPDQTNASPIGNTKAALNTQVNPEGKATTYHFEYVDDASYDTEGEFASPKTKTTPEEAITTAAEPSFAPPLFRLSAASAPIGCTDPEDPPQPSCLAPETEYHFRAVAKNADGEDIGLEATFTTKSPFEILATWSSEVGIDAAKLGAEVNPLNIPAKGHFKYVEEAICLKDLEELGVGHCFDQAQGSAEVNFGSGEAPVIRSIQLHSLKADTAYRFRVFVEDPFASEFGEERAFTTFPPPLAEPDPCPNKAFRVGPSAGLPDCRAYEMVSPVDKAGGEIEVLGSSENISEAEILQSAAVVPAKGRGLTYSSSRAFGDAISAPYTSQYIANRHPLGDPEEGWSSHGISPLREGISFSIIVQDVQYKAFSEDLGWGWLRSDTEPPLEPKAIPGFPNLYWRDNASETYEAICPVEPKDVAPSEYNPKVQGNSADGEMTVLRANSKLTPDASGAKLPAGTPIYQLYACAAGEPRLVSMAPGGEASGGNSSVGTIGAASHRQDSVHNAVSVDGSRVYWTDMDQELVGPGRIYLRERPFGEGAECAGPAAPCTAAVSGTISPEPAQFWTASPDGSVAIFSFTEGGQAGNLYEFDAGSETTSLIAEGVSGLAGWSEDASRLYLVSTKALAPGAVAGKPNLYLHEAGDFDLVAALPSGTVSTLYCQVSSPNPFMRCTRATADGGRLVFMSGDPLTGYDNKDALSGERDAEVFLYEANANGGEGELLCVSCNPSGGRPAGQRVEVYGGTKWPISARIPAGEYSLYAPRALSADGRRLFFESFDALVVQTDTNGAQDVYQWEETGKGDCDTEDHNYFAQNGGCLSLISSGRSLRDSEFIDASADGSDVFFKTAASLLPQDPGLADIYDARVEGGFPISPEEKPPCEGEACQSPSPALEAPTPASAGFRGPGDPKANSSRRRCPKGKHRARRGGKARCVKKQRKGKRRPGRARR